MTITKKDVMIQYFQWYLPDDGNHWNRVKENAKALADAGFTMIWLPPAYKGCSGIHDVGYGVYDMYDLGEFDQKGTIKTKYGSKDEYLSAIDALHQNGFYVLADMVFNHKMGADGTENVKAEKVNASNREQIISDPTMIEAWTKFDYTARNNKYSDFKWNASCFDGVDFDDRKDEHAIYQFEGRQWDEGVDDENGNYDYLMGADVDFSNQSVIDEYHRYGKWVKDFTHIDGFRLDALKHIDNAFFKGWLDDLRHTYGETIFTVGEYWSSNLHDLLNYLYKNDHCMSLFDVPLHYRFSQISTANGLMDMADIFADTLVAKRPGNAVTFVENHDTQAGQALQSVVGDWFKPMAYACILLRHEGIPCVFYGDYYGIEQYNVPSYKELIDLMIKLRNDCMDGYRYNYFDSDRMIGWSYEGSDRNHGVVVLFTDETGGHKIMYCGVSHAYQEYMDILHPDKPHVKLDVAGNGEFVVDGGSMAIYVPVEYGSTIQ